jgi:3-carboxy-cis,cis-muconate cycloisomerase
VAGSVLDRLGEYVTLMALLGATCGKIGQEMFTGMKDEFGELEEPWSHGTVGSSTVPHKRNPVLSEDIMVGAFATACTCTDGRGSIAGRARDEPGRQSARGQGGESACEILGDRLERVRLLVEGLNVDEARIRRNLDISGGLILSEALILRLGQSIGRQEAHDVIYDAAQGARNG